MSLFLRECKKVLLSIPYLIFVVVFIGFLMSQGLCRLTPIEEPSPGGSYGYKSAEIPEIIMPAAVDALYQNYLANEFTAYPIGFYKNVKLNAGEREKMAEILSELTGLPVAEIENSAGQPSGATVQQDGENSIQVEGGNITENPDGSFTVNPGGETANAPQTVSPAPDLSYDRFQELMNEADRLLGGGSDYGETYRTDRFGRVPVTYEEALAQYNDILSLDRVSGSYARYFCDYSGIILGIIPVFISVAMGLKDRRSGVRDLIYARKTSSVKIVCTRYLAMVVCSFLPVLAFSGYLTGEIFSLNPGLSIDGTAVFRYALGWLLPTLMTSLAVGMLFTELTDTPVAILVQVGWFFLNMFGSLAQMNGGGYSMDLIPRHNTIGNTRGYYDHFASLLCNRVFYAVLAILLVLVTVFLYEQKRRGKYHGIDAVRKIFRRRGQQPAA